MRRLFERPRKNKGFGVKGRNVERLGSSIHCGRLPPILMGRRSWCYKASSAEAHCARKDSVPDVLNARAADRMAEPVVVRISCAGSGWLRVEWLGVKAEVDQMSIDEEKLEH